MVKRYISQLEFSCNTYLIINEKNESILIDPGCFSRRLDEDLKNTKLLCILLTHGHFDHIAYLDKIKSIYNDVDVYCFEENDFLIDSKKNGSFYNDKKICITTEFKQFNNTLCIGDFIIDVYLTPGHTGGSVIYYFKDNKSIFFGDTIILNSIGRMDLYSGSSYKMKESLQLIKSIDFNDNDICFFGHENQVDFKTLKLINKYL